MLSMAQRRFEIELTPVNPSGAEAAQRIRPRFADASIVIGDDIHAIRKKRGGKTGIVPTAHGGRGIDDDHRPRRPFAWKAPYGSFDRIPVSGLDNERIRHKWTCT